MNSNFSNLSSKKSEQLYRMNSQVNTNLEDMEGEETPIKQELNEEDMYAMMDGEWDNDYDCGGAADIASYMYDMPQMPSNGPVIPPPVSTIISNRKKSDAPIPLMPVELHRGEEQVQVRPDFSFFNAVDPDQLSSSSVYQFQQSLSYEKEQPRQEIPSFLTDVDPVRIVHIAKKVESYIKPLYIEYNASQKGRPKKVSKKGSGRKTDGAWDVRDRFDVGYEMTQSQINEHLANNYYKYTSNDDSRYLITYVPFNVAKAKYMLENSGHYKETMDDVFSDESLNCLRRMVTTSPNGLMKCRFHPSRAYRNNEELKSRDSQGRMFAVQAVGPQGIKKEIRAELFLNIMSEVDLENCHFRIIGRIAKNKFNMNPNVVIDYIENREERIAEIIAVNPTKTRADVKEALLSILNGSKGKMLEFTHTPFLVDLHNQCIDIRDNIVKSNPKLYAEFAKINESAFRSRWKAWKKNEDDPNKKKYGEPWKKNAAASTMSHYLLSEENKIIKEARVFFEEKGVIKNDACMPCFDGLYVRFDEDGEIAKMIPELEERINKDDVTGIKYKFKLKNVDSPAFDHDEALRSDRFKTSFDKVMKEGIKLEIKGKGFKKRMRRFKGFSKVFRKATGLELTSSTINICQQRLMDYGPILEIVDILMIRSIMGSGKTFNTYKWLEEQIAKNKDLRVMVVSFRRSIENKYGEDLAHLGFENYLHLDPKGGLSSEEHPRLIVQVNSLKRVSGKYDVLLLDEVSYTFDIVHGFCSDKSQVYETLKSYVKHTPKILCLDAYLTDANVEYMRDLRDEKKIAVVENKKTKDNGKTYVFDYEQFMAKISKKVDDNKRIAIVSNSLQFLENKIAPILDNAFTGTDKKYLIISSEAMKDKTKEEQDAIINKNNWGKYDVVAYTPTVTAGISFEETGVFDSIFGYFCNKSATADIGTQMLFRIRYPICTDYTLHFNSIMDHDVFDTSDEGLDIIIYRYIVLEEQCKHKFLADLVKQQKVRFEPFNRKYDDIAQYNLLKDWLRKKMTSYNNYPAVMLYYLDVQGYPLHSYEVTDAEIQYSNSAAKIHNKIIADAKVIRVEAELQDYLDAPDIEGFKFRELRKKERKTRADKISMKRYQISTLLGDKTFEEVFTDDEDKLAHVLRDLKYMYLDRSDKCLDLDREDDCLEVNNKTLIEAVWERVMNNRHHLEILQHDQGQRDFWLEIFLGLCAVEALGFKNHNDFATRLYTGKGENKRFLEDLGLEKMVESVTDHDEIVKALLYKYDMTEWRENVLKCGVASINSIIKYCGRKVVILGSEARLLPLFTAKTIAEAPELHQPSLIAMWKEQQRKAREPEKKKTSLEKKRARQLKKNATARANRKKSKKQLEKEKKDRADEKERKRIDREQKKKDKEAEKERKRIVREQKKKDKAAEKERKRIVREQKRIAREQKKKDKVAKK